MSQAPSHRTPLWGFVFPWGFVRNPAAGQAKSPAWKTLCAKQFRRQGGIFRPGVTPVFLLERYTAVSCLNKKKKKIYNSVWKQILMYSSFAAFNTCVSCGKSRSCEHCTQQGCKAKRKGAELKHTRRSRLFSRWVAGQWSISLDHRGWIQSHWRRRRSKQSYAMRVYYNTENMWFLCHLKYIRKILRMIFM